MYADVVSPPCSTVLLPFSRWEESRSVFGGVLVSLQGHGPRFRKASVAGRPVAVWWMPWPGAWHCLHVQSGAPVRAVASRPRAWECGRLYRMLSVLGVLRVCV